MPTPLTRRHFLERVAAASAVAAAPVAARAAAVNVSRGGPRPVVIASANGWHPPADRGGGTERGSAVETTLRLLRDPDIQRKRFGLLEAVVAGVAEVENDPTDHSVGLGGLPNEEGVVQLDASVMFGPTHQSGAVAAIENIQNPARVAMYVLRYTDHSMIVGEGAYRFARAFGIEHAELLTEEARKIWLYWRQSHSDRDDWLTPPDEDVGAAVLSEFTHGTIHLSAVDENGDLAAVTTTSGLSYKIPGRIGDSPIVGAGMYCDNEVGSAGATGRGEEAIVNCGAFSVVSAMAAGREPIDACLDVLKRVAHNGRKRGLVKDGKPTFDLKFYAVRKDGTYGSAAMFAGGKYAVIDGASPSGRHEACGWLYDR